MASPPNSDFAYWSGFTLGAALGYYPLGIENPWLALGVSLASGIGLGLLLVRLRPRALRVARDD